MSIHVIGAEDKMPLVDVLFYVEYLMKPKGRMRLHTYTELYRDEDGEKIIEVYLHPYGFDLDSLKQSYLKLMDHATMYDLKTMVIPLFPHSMKRAECISAACDAFLEKRNTCDVSVYLQLEDQEPLTKKERMILTIANYIAETSDTSEREKHLPRPELDQYYGEPANLLVQPGEAVGSVMFSADPVCADSARFDPASGVFQLDAGFGETVLKLIEAKGLTESECYKKANLTRAAFYRIRQSARDPENPYRPTKQTALALAVALELDLDEAKDLLERAGYSFSHSSRGDIIVEYFLIHGKYNIFEINEMLYCYDLPLLGSQ